MTLPDPLASNRAHWESMAAVHAEGVDRYYDIDALVRGESRLFGAERTALAVALAGRPLAGLDVLHVQCHLAFDGIDFARQGARVTGVDFSPTALSKAADIARQAGVDLDLVEADSTALPASLHGRFDLAWATIGVICWIGDLDAWMRSVAATLRPGGRLVLVDLHPVFNCVGSTDPLVLDWPYADAGPQLETSDTSYAGVGLGHESTTVEFAHSLGETVTAAVDAGLRVLHLGEHLEIERDPRGDVLPREADGLYRLRAGTTVLPVLFSLVAER